MLTRKLLHVIGMGCALAFGTPLAQAQQQGVTKDQILIATIQDLSGPVARYGKHGRDGVMMRIEEANAQGGINGRKIKLLIEDNAYDPKRAVLVAQKLVNQDRVFLIVGHVGAAQNNAAMPVLFEKNMINFMPISTSAESFEPPHQQLKFGFLPPYSAQMATGIPPLLKKHAIEKPCIIYQDDEMGLEVLRSTEAVLQDAGSKLHVKTSYKRGATDFSSAVAKMKAGECQMVVLGTVFRETVGVVTEARKVGFQAVFLGTSNSYMDLVHKLGGPAMDGLYGVTMGADMPYPDVSEEPLRRWVQKYQAKFGEEPSLFSVYGYKSADLFVKAATRAGNNLTTDTFIEALENMEIPADEFGYPPIKMSRDDHLAVKTTSLAQIVNGRWKVLDR